MICDPILIVAVTLASNLIPQMSVALSLKNIIHLFNTYFLSTYLARHCHFSGYCGYTL
jgi:hypothetical protein